MEKNIFRYYLVHIEIVQKNTLTFAIQKSNQRFTNTCLSK